MAPALQRLSKEGAKQDSGSCLEMVSRNREWGLLGRDKPEQEQREVPSPVWIEWAWPGTGTKWMKSQFRQLKKLPFTIYIYIIFSLYFSLNKITLPMYEMCISQRSCSQTRPGIFSQTRPGVSLCSLPILSLPGRGFFPVSWHTADTGLLHMILVL